jgi:hypothetical protein
MSFFGLRSGTERYGVVIDIGSGSALAAIVHSNPNDPHPTIVWSHREHVPLRNIDSIDQSAKAVMTALVNVSMLLDAEGRRALYEYDNSARLSEIQTTIAAPWSYTVTKTINYTQEENFTVTNDLIEDLRHTARQNVEDDIRGNSELDKLGLQVITEASMAMLANQYRVADPAGNEAKTFSITRAYSISQQYLLDAIEEMRDKLFSHVESRKISFILTLYTATRELLNQTNDVCLIDITYEATEIGIIRDGVLQYTTHTPFGSFSLAREISSITGAPLHESFGYLHSDEPYAFLKSLTKSQKEDVEAVFEAYTERINALFHETGDSLTIPNNISLHTQLRSEPLFKDIIEKATKRATKAKASITSISEQIIKHAYTESKKSNPNVAPKDATLLLSAQFFHKRPTYQTFRYQ